MATARSNKQVKLNDGRLLVYVEYGDPAGKPVIYFHGFPGTRLDWPVVDVDDAATELGARIIAVDRPGTGLSDFKSDRKILDWPDDVIELTDALQLDRFAVMGYSGGAPYTAACALSIPERLTATAIVAGLCPPEAPGIKEAMAWSIFSQSSEVRRPMLMGLARSLDQVAVGMNESYPAGHPDKVILEQPGFAKTFIDLTFGEALRLGVDGVDQDAALFALPWGFQLQDIGAEVHLWHGEQDLNVPISAARYVASTIPNCHATFFEDEGHVSIVHNRIQEILNVLVR